MNDQEAQRYLADAEINQEKSLMKNDRFRFGTAVFNPVKAGYNLYNNKGDLGILSSLKGKYNSNNILWAKDKRITDLIPQDDIN